MRVSFLLKAYSFLSQISITVAYALRSKTVAHVIAMRRLLYSAFKTTAAFIYGSHAS